MIHTPSASRRGAFRVVLAYAMAGSCAFAQAQPEATASSSTLPEAELPPVTVSAHDGRAVPCAETGVSVSVLDIPELKKEGIISLSEALTTVPGVYVLPGGGLSQRGNTSNLVIRGMNSQSYTLPMLDGMPVDTISGDGLTLSNLVARAQLFDLGKAEVLKGTQGAIYGSGAMGGVLYLETPEGRGKPSWSLFNEAGSFDSYTGNITAQGQVKKLSYFLSATYERTNNDPEYANGAHPPFKHAGKYENWSEAIRLDHAFNEQNKLTLTYRRQDSEFRDSQNMYPQKFTFMSNLLTARFRSQITERYASSLMVGYSGQDNRLGEDWYPELRNVQVEWRHRYDWNETNTTTAGLRWLRSDYHVNSTLDSARTSRDLNNTYSLFAEHSFSPAKGWDNSLALRLDQSSNFDTMFTARAATSYRCNKSRLFASAGRGYRSPTSFQTGSGEYSYPGWYGGTTVYRGNPDLKCSTDWSVDVGLEQEFAPDQFASATLFWSRVEDGILTKGDYLPDKTVYTYTNSDAHWTIQGVELALRGTLEKTWNTGYRLACTLTQPKSSDDRQLPSTARQTYSADIHTSPLEGLTTGFGLVAADGRRAYTGSHLDGYYSLRWFAQYKVNEHLTLHLRIENLTDQKFMTDASYMGADYAFINPGTAIYGGCTLQF